MKPSARLALLFSSLFLAAALASAPLAQAQDQEAREVAAPPPAPSAEQVAWLAHAKTDYPLRTCLVTGESLAGGMGGPVDYIHKAEGQPDRLVRLCCRACLRDFKRSPERYLKRLDAATAAKAEHAADTP